MMGLSDGRKNFPIGLAISIQYRSVTASQPASHPASHVAVAITLNAKASSLKSARIDANSAGELYGGAKNFRPAADPLPGDAGPPKFNQLEMVTTFTYKLSLVRIDARNFELSW